MGLSLEFRYSQEINWYTREGTSSWKSYIRVHMWCGLLTKDVEEASSRMKEENSPGRNRELPNTILDLNYYSSLLSSYRISSVYNRSSPLRRANERSLPPYFLCREYVSVY